MAVGAWTFYPTGKKYIGSADIDLNGATFHMSLFTSASNAATQDGTLTAIGSLSNEVAAANGYAAGGKTITGVTWTISSSASGKYRFNSSAVYWSANAGTIQNIKFAVIWAGASAAVGKLLCKSTLSTSQFTLASGSRLTITPSATGIFELE